jgi:drug/metabolite transporter (DMT)-like permease
MGNGLVTWAEQYVSSGVAALICSTMPISAVIINIAGGREKLNMLILAGMLLGFGGVALIFRDNLQQSGSSELFVWGIIALFVATFSWALGSILNKRKAPAVNVLMDSGIQVFAGGAIMLLISPVADDYSKLVLWNQEGFTALCYLIVFGSVLAYAAYMYALKELPVGFVTSYAYVNPLVAVILGSLFLDEPMNSTTVIAFVLILAGIFIVRNGYKRQERLKKIAE